MAFDVLFEGFFHHLVELAVFFDGDAFELLHEVGTEPLPLADPGNTLCRGRWIRSARASWGRCGLVHLCTLRFVLLCTF